LSSSVFWRFDQALVSMRTIQRTHHCQYPTKNSTVKPFPSTATPQGPLFADGAGAAAQFKGPVRVAVDGEGSIIIAESGNKQLRKITSDSTVRTLFAGGCGCYGVAIDADGCVIVCTNEDTVAKIAGCSVAAPGAAEQRRRLAFCMLSHERLGHGPM
jgi:hypothetical protein